MSWSTISPDLTKNEKDKHGPGGGPFTNEAAGGENYNTITTLVESQHEEGVLYAGTDDGLLQITKNGGQSWEAITPKGIEDGIINSVDVSDFDPATAYVVIMRYKSMDLNSYIYKTNNYGKSWTKITEGLNDPNGFARVVRADKKRKELLYCGTETGLYVSFNDGKTWERFKLNLPVVPINDLIIQDNDLVAATSGRGFWILDDLAAFQQIKNQTELQLFQPKDSYRIFGGNSNAVGQGQNPRTGVTFNYFIPKGKDTLDLKLDIYQNNTLIKSYSNKKPNGFKSWPGGPSAPQVMPSAVGINSFTWDFSTEDLPPVEKVFVFGGLSGYSKSPGAYRAKLSQGDAVLETTFKVLDNPAIDASPADYAEQQKALETITLTVKDIHESVNNMRSAKSQLQHYENLLEDEESAKELITKGDELIKRISTWEENLIQPKQKTFQDVINYNNKLNAQLINLKGYIDQADPKMTSGAQERLNDLLKDWQVYKSEHNAIVNTEMAKYNEAFKALNLPAIIIED